MLVLFSCSNSDNDRVEKNSISLFNKNYQVANYYKNILDAENFIVNKDYQQALISYKEAFNIKKIPFRIDLENAIICAFEVDSSDDLFYFFKVYAKYLGYPKDIFIRSEEYDLANEHYQSQLFQFLKQYDSYTTYYNDNIYDEGRAKLYNKLLELDQKWRKKRTKDNHELYQQKIEQNDQVVLRMMIKDVKKNGFPEEHKIGVNYNTGDGKITPLIWHNIQTSKKLQKITENAVLHGKYYSDYFEMCINQTRGISKYDEIKLQEGFQHATVIWIDGIPYAPNRRKCDSAKIEMRQKYYLEGCDEVHCKIQQSGKQSHIRFNLKMNQVQIHDYKTEKDKEIAKRRMGLRPYVEMYDCL